MKQVRYYIKERLSAISLGILPLVFAVVTLYTSVVNGQTIKSKADSTEIIIGKPINFSIEIDVPQGTTIKFPIWADTLGNKIEILDKGKLDTVRIEGKTNFILKQTLVLTSFDSGVFFILPQPFIINNDSSKLLFTEPIQIKVNYPKVDLSKEIKDIKPPLDPPFDWYYVWMIALVIIGILVVLILGWFAFKYFLKNERPFAKLFEEKKLPPHQIAFNKLEELRKEKLWQNGREKEYHVAISEIVREYIEGRFEIPALEQVTDETIHNISAKLNPQDLELLVQLLRLSDLVKFARQQPGPGENELSINNALAFVKSTMPLETQEAKTQK